MGASQLVTVGAKGPADFINKVITGIFLWATFGKPEYAYLALVDAVMPEQAEHHIPLWISLASKGGYAFAGVLFYADTTCTCPSPCQ